MKSVPVFKVSSCVFWYKCRSCYKFENALRGTLLKFIAMWQLYPFCETKIVNV